MLKQCPICQKEFHVKPSHAWRVCCSRECKSAYMRLTQSGEDNPNYKPELTKICKGCGKAFRKYDGSDYCSRQCRPHAMDICRDCGAEIRLSPSLAQKLKRQPYCRACYARHQAAVEQGTRLRVQTCVTCGARFDAPHRRKYCDACKPYQVEHRTCIVCGSPFTGRRSTSHSKNTKIRQTCSYACLRIYHNGNLASSPDDLERQAPAYKSWRAAVLERDQHTCQLCGVAPQKPHVHHILAFKDYPQYRLDVTNGITLCASCHVSIRVNETDYIQQFQALVQQKTVSP